MSEETTQNEKNKRKCGAMMAPHFRFLFGGPVLSWVRAVLALNAVIFF